MTQADAYLLLNASGLSPRRQHLLIGRYGSARGIFAALDAEPSATEGVDSASIRLLRQAQQGPLLEQLRESCQRWGVAPVGVSEQGYPPLLRQVDLPPTMLFVQGELTDRDQLAVGIVGTRKASPYGLVMAERLASELAQRGFTVVSGLAAGIDCAAHEAALEAGGRTVAVMANGPDITYPAHHRNLRERIAQQGAVVTEYGFGISPVRERFPARNRIIAGMSLGIVVVEAPDRSGALITAGHAADQGREVFAVPGEVTNPNSRGCHALIKDGARIVEFAEDVIEGLGIILQAVPQRERRQAPDLLGDERAVYDALGFQPLDADAIAEKTSLPAANVSAALMLLEVKGHCQRFPGGAFTRKS